MRSHPKNPWIRNSLPARWLIFFTRHRWPGFSRLYMLFLNCDIGCGLPRNVFLPHPFGIVIHSNTRIGEDVVIGHQVTLACRQRGVILRNIGDVIVLMPAPAMPEELVVELCRVVREAIANVVVVES